MSYNQEMWGVILCEYKLCMHNFYHFVSLFIEHERELMNSTHLLFTFIWKRTFRLTGISA